MSSPIDVNTKDASCLFDGSRLTLARNLLGFRKNELAAKIGKSQTAVAAWEQGTKRPTPSNVAALSIALGVDPGFFIAGVPNLRQPNTLPHFRSLRSTTQLQRDQADAYGTLAMEVAWMLERNVEFRESDIPCIPASDDEESDEPELAARAVREAWNLGSGPIRHMIRELENHGIFVVFSPPRAASLDAFSVQAAPHSMVILNPTKDDYYRQRFDVAHELGHLIMHADTDPGSHLVESQANRFAAELLAPADAIYDSLPTSINATTWRRLMDLKEEWRVSIQALLMRCRVLGRLSEVAYRNAMMSLSKNGWRRAEPGAIWVLEQPSILPRAVELLNAEGISECSIAKQGHIPLSLFRIITSRTPAELQDGDPIPEDNERRVVPLFSPHIEATTSVGIETIDGSEEKGGENHGER